MLNRLFACVTLASASVAIASPSVQIATPEAESRLVRSAAQPPEFQYLAFPSLLQISADEVWLAYKAGRSHATDAGAAIEVVRHTLSTGKTTLLQRLAAPPPKLYQMGELARYADGTIALHMDVHDVGWDGRHYRTGAEVSRFNPDRQAFASPAPLGRIEDMLYGYPLDFATVGNTTWQVIMSFGYHGPENRWGVDAIRTSDSGQTWTFIRNLTEEFGGIRANETALVRHGSGFIVTTRGYDRIERLHRTDGNFKVEHQVELTGAYPFIHSYIGRPRLFIRDGFGYLIGRNWTRPVGPKSPMQLCLFRFDPDTLALLSCVVLDNAEDQNVTDGYYAVTAFSGEDAETRLHVFTYKALDKARPDIVRLDYRWSEVK